MAPKHTVKQLQQTHERTLAEQKALEDKYAQRYSQETKDALERQARAERDFEAPWSRWREAGVQAKHSEDHAQQLEKDFKKAVDEFERTGKDPNPPGVTRDLGEKAERARSVADMDRQNEEDATEVFRAAEKELSDARTEVRHALRHDPAQDALENDPQYKALQQRSQQEAEQIHQQQVIDGDVSVQDVHDDGQTVAAVSAAGAGADLGLDGAHPGAVGDDAIDSHVAGLGQHADVADSAPDAGDGGGVSSSVFGDATSGDIDTSGGTDSTGDLDASAGFGDVDQEPEPQMAIVDSGPQQDFDESADYDA